jgi:hypothetical protein
MAKQMRDEAILALPSGDLVDLLSANPAVLDTNEHLSDVEPGDIDFVDFQGGILFHEHSGFHSTTPAPSVHASKRGPG